MGKRERQIPGLKPGGRVPTKRKAVPLPGVSLPCGHDACQESGESMKAMEMEIRSYDTRTPYCGPDSCSKTPGTS